MSNCKNTASYQTLTMDNYSISPKESFPLDYDNIQVLDDEGNPIPIDFSTVTFAFTVFLGNTESFSQLGTCTPIDAETGTFSILIPENTLKNDRRHNFETFINLPSTGEKLIHKGEINVGL